eukprot:16447113-Heterocapsa_arctica.AAC.1
MARAAIQGGGMDLYPPETCTPNVSDGVTGGDRGEASCVMRIAPDIPRFLSRNEKVLAAIICLERSMGSWSLMR